MHINEMERALFDRLASGWNTWDVRSVTAHVRLPEKLRLNVAIIVPHMSGYSGDTAWEHVERFGEHAADGSYTEVFIRYLGGIYRVESAADGAELVLKITPVEPRYGAYVMLEVGQAWDARIDIAYEGEAIRAACGGGEFRIDAVGTPVTGIWNPAKTANIMLPLDGAAYFRVNSSRDQAGIDEWLAASQAAWLSGTVTADGELGEGLDAMRRSLLWNTIYDARNGRVISPVSRNWCLGNGRGFGDYVLFGWDTFFAALQMGLVSKELAYANMFGILEEITPEGMIPNLGCANGLSRDRSEPQVGALCAWKLYLQYGDLWFIEACFDRLLSWNRWRFENRDLNGDGLLVLASTPWEREPDEEVWWHHDAAFTKLGASLESGIDNSPMWDRARFNEELHCHELSYFGLCCEMVFDCELLEKMADLLGRAQEREELRARREKLTERINANLWDEERGFYMNRHWSGEFDPCVSLTGFYALTAGIANEDQIHRMISGYLLNEEKFGGEFVIPNVARDDPAFADQDYWRGRIWAPTNYLVGEGLLRTRQDEARDTLIQKGLALFVKCWREKGVVGENYSAITGDAAEKDKASDRFYHWGALLVYMAVEALICFNPWTDETERRPMPPWLDGTVLRNVPVGDEKLCIERDAG